VEGAERGALDGEGELRQIDTRSGHPGALDRAVEDGLDAGAKLVELGGALRGGSLEDGFDRRRRS
jgi:hypothetical protein